MSAVVRGQTAAWLCFPPHLMSLWLFGTRALPSTALLINALFITFLHLNKSETTKTQLNGRSSPKYFPKASLFRESLG